MIVQVKTNDIVIQPKYIGGDGPEYCYEHNLFNVVSQKGEKWFIDVDEEAFELDKSIQIVYSWLNCSKEDCKNRISFGAKCYKNYEDIVRDRRKVDTPWRCRGKTILTDYIEFVKIMPSRTITVDGVTEIV